MNSSKPIPNPSAAILLIGDEILSGRTQDANLQPLALFLDEKGIELMEVRILQDHIPSIAQTINTLRSKHHFVFTTGGIGPTHDDKTAQAVALAFKTKLVRNPDALQSLSHHAKRAGRTLNEARLKMADMPLGAQCIQNSISGAPGFQIQNVFVLAGVPVIMRDMLKNLAPLIKNGEPSRALTLTARLAEGDIAEKLGRIQNNYPSVKIGSYPSYENDGPILRIVLRSRDNQNLNLAAHHASELIKSLTGEKPLQNQGQEK